MRWRNCIGRAVNVLDGALMVGIKVPLKSRDIAALGRLARSKGVPREQLVRSWVLQRIARHNNPRRAKRSA